MRKTVSMAREGYTYPIVVEHDFDIAFICGDGVDGPRVDSAPGTFDDEPNGLALHRKITSELA